MNFQHIKKHHMIDHRSQSVSIGMITETGKWVAMRSISPMFCLDGETAEDVEKKARDIIDTWYSLKAGLES